MRWEEHIIYQDLVKIISYTDSYYNDININWNNNRKINLKKKIVLDVRNETDILDTIFKYRSFINEATVDFVFGLENLEILNSEVTCRVKSQNSIEFKIDNYIKNHENGMVPIKKCLNDLFGIRIIINEDISNKDILNYLFEAYPEYKCIESLKMDYIATHLYFEKDNFSFPWELQIWSKSKEKSNLMSHKKYKQEYTRWENENKKDV